MKLEEKEKFKNNHKEEKIMRTRQEAVEFGLTFKDTYVETPFRDANWQLVRVKKSKKAFLWIYERDGFINLNIKVNPEWRDFGEKPINL